MRNLKELRIERGLYPSFISSKLGISQRHFNRIEHGQGYLTDNRMSILSQLYNVDISELKQAFERSRINAGENEK